jgi:hypothetical protein
MTELFGDWFESLEGGHESSSDLPPPASAGAGPAVGRYPTDGRPEMYPTSGNYPVEQTFWAIPGTHLCHYLGQFARVNPRRRPNQTKKGEGPESKQHAADEWDDYQASRGMSCPRLSELGRAGITLAQLQKLCDNIAAFMKAKNITLTKRNRWAKRRKPNAFHWLDENWGTISSVFDDVALHTLSLI